MTEEIKAMPDLSEQIRRELERITSMNMQGVALNFDYDDDDDEHEDDEDEEDENAIHLTALIEDNALILSSSTLPNDWGAGKEIILNGMRFCPFVAPTPASPPPPPPPPRTLSVLTDKSNMAPSAPSPSSRKSPRRQEKENLAPETDVDAEEKVLSALKRRKSQDLSALVSPSEQHCGFLAKLTRHGTYADRWCELDPLTKSFNYWTTRAARGVCPPTSLAVSDILSVEWNAKDIKEGKRRNIMGLGGARFVITSKLGATTWRAKDPLVTLKWITGIQDMLDQIEQPAIHIQESATAPPAEFERKVGLLQRMNAAGRYKDRWCELDANRKTLSYWAKKSHWETQAAPKGMVDFKKVTSIAWNPEDVRKGRRRSLLSKDGVRFTLLSGDSVQSWRSNNPLEASEWSRDLAAVLALSAPQKA